MSTDMPGTVQQLDQQLRFVEFVLIPNDEGLHPVDAAIAAHPELTRESILNINLLPDETVTVLYQLRGDIHVARDIIDGHDSILDYNLSLTDDSIHAYAHLVPSAGLVDLLQIPQDLDLITDLPFEYTAQGGLRMRTVGDFDAIRRSAAAIPDCFQVIPERIGEYCPGTDRVFNQLTPRQRETLQIAVELGYYENPRGATLKDIADVMDRTDGTVGDHLRKIEEYVMGHVVP